MHIKHSDLTWPDLTWPSFMPLGHPAACNEWWSDFAGGAAGQLYPEFPGQTDEGRPAATDDEENSKTIPLPGPVCSTLPRCQVLYNIMRKTPKLSSFQDLYVQHYQDVRYYIMWWEKLQNYPPSRTCMFNITKMSGIILCDEKNSKTIPLPGLVCSTLPRCQVLYNIMRKTPKLSPFQDLYVQHYQDVRYYIM